jgi:CRISPR-associated protein Csb2
VFGTDWLVFREVAEDSGQRVGLRLTRAVDVAGALRGALMRHADDPPPGLLSGHAEDGRPLRMPHAAFISLPDVAGKWASGAILGAAVVLPRDCPPDERRAVLQAIGRWEAAENGNPLRLLLGRAGVMLLERIIDPDPRVTLRPEVWCGPACHWASVSAVALDLNPGDLGSPDATKANRAADTARAVVAKACQRIGLPAPASVEIMRRSVFDQCPEAKRFMPFPNQDGAIRRVCVHVEIVFDRAVEGPILLGAGRYQGLGLLRSVRDHGRVGE